MTHNESQDAREPKVEPAFVTGNVWRDARPRILVVACSDGRYQLSLDEFLDGHLGVAHYDRFYAPGGPGALASSAFSYLRGEHYRQDSAFLVDAHRLEQVVFVFHGPSISNGPIEATCADYSRKMPGAGTGEIYRQQEADLQEAAIALIKVKTDIVINAYRAEVRSDMRVQYVPLAVKPKAW